MSTVGVETDAGWFTRTHAAAADVMFTWASHPSCQKRTCKIIQQLLSDYTSSTVSRELFTNTVVPRTIILRRPTTIGSSCPSQRSYAWCQADEAARPTAWQTVFSRCYMCALNKRVMCSAEVPQLRRLRRHQMCCTACTKGFQSHLQCVAAFTWSEAARRAPARKHIEARFTSCVCRREMSSARGTFGVIWSGGGRPRPV